MADRNTPQNTRGIGVWPLALGLIVAILAAVMFFMSEPVEAPVATPSSPEATGTVGEPAGLTGDGTQPGAPEGADVPAGAPLAQPNPDVAPGTGIDTTRGN